MRRAARASIAILFVAAAVAGCGTFDSKGVEYKSAGKLPPLEVPPDLTRPGRDERYAVPDISPSGTATFSQYEAERKGGRAASASSEVLPVAEAVRIARDGNTRYLVVSERADRLWPLVREFWQENGFLLKIEMPDAGVMETDWAENRAKIPEDWLRNSLGKLLDSAYSSGERDKFRTRLERTADGAGTEIFISHRGMVEQLVSKRDLGTDGTTVWQPRPADPELEAEFLRRLMVKLGVDDARARAQVGAVGKRDERAKLVTASDGAPMLDVNEPFDRAWRRVGLALDRVGFTVEDRDRSKGVYFVRYVDPEVDGQTKGLLSSLAFWRSDEPNKAVQYQVVVKPGDEITKVQVLNKEGAPESGGTSKKILGLLYDQLK